MSKEELIQFLKDNLSLYLETKYGYHGQPTFKISLKIQGELLCEDWINIQDLQSE